MSICLKKRKEEVIKTVEFIKKLFIGYFVFYALAYLTFGVPYGYWGLSIGMAPLLCGVMIIGAMIGFVITMKNLVKVVKEMIIKE